MQNYHKTNKSINKSKCLSVIHIEGKPRNNTNSEINGSVITDFNTCNYLGIMTEVNVI